MPQRPNRPVYLDNQATTPCDPRVVQAMLPWFSESFGNPHSAEHVLGRQAEAAVEAARTQVAALIGAEPREIDMLPEELDPDGFGHGPERGVEQVARLLSAEVIERGAQLGRIDLR